jgi:hypothetical protein
MSQASYQFNKRVGGGKLWFHNGRGSIVPLYVIPAPPDSTQRAVSVLHNTEGRTKVGSKKVAGLIRLFRFSECFSFCPPRTERSVEAPNDDHDGTGWKEPEETI